MAANLLNCLRMTTKRTTLIGSQPVRGDSTSAPQSFLEAIWAPVGPHRAGRPQTVSTEAPGGHLMHYGPEPGRKAPNTLHRASWRPSGALWARTGPGGSKRSPQRLLEGVWGSEASTGPGGPKRAPQSLLEAIWGNVGPNQTIAEHRAPQREAQSKHMHSYPLDKHGFRPGVQDMQPYVEPALWFGIHEPTNRLKYGNLDTQHAHH